MKHVLIYVKILFKIAGKFSIKKWSWLKSKKNNETIKDRRVYPTRSLDGKLDQNWCIRSQSIIKLKQYTILLVNQDVADWLKSIA